MAGINLNSGDTTYESVESSETAVDIVAENGNRVGLYIMNNSSSVLYLRIDGTASSSDYTLKLAAGGLYEMPRGYFTDKVSGIWASENGTANVTEISTRSHADI